MEIKAVIFDVDDTLYDYVSGDILGKQAAAAYMKEHFGVSEEEFPAAFRRAFKEQQEKIGFLTASSHNRLIRFQFILEHLGLPVWPHAAALAKLYWDTLIEAARPEEGLCELMQALKKAGIRIGYGTNMTSYIQMRKIEKLDLWKYTDFFVASEETGTEKPDSRFFDVCVAKAGCLPEECVFIGDNVKGDCLGAQSAGLKAVRYLGGVKQDELEKELSCFSENIVNYRDCLQDDGIRLGSYLIPLRPAASAAY